LKAEQSGASLFGPAHQSALIIARRVVDDRKAEFVAKLGTVEEEADESAFWMEVIIEGELLKQAQVQSLLDEANELVRIMARSRLSAIRRGSTSARRAGPKMDSNRQSAIGNRQ